METLDRSLAVVPRCTDDGTGSEQFGSTGESTSSTRIETCRRNGATSTTTHWKWIIKGSDEATRLRNHLPEKDLGDGEELDVEERLQDLGYP